MAVGLLVAGCASQPAATGSTSAGVQSLNVADVDGPPVDLLIGGAVVASVPCSGYTTLTEGSGAVPRLPWSLDVRRQGGALLEHFEVTTGDGWSLLLRGDTVALGQFGSNGPTTDPDACARWSAQPSTSATQDLHVDNGTTKDITIVVDGTTAATVPAGQSATVALGAVPPGAWSVEARLPGGRDIARARFDKAATALLGASLRTDLSCGRLDLWIAVPMLGPAPGPGTPGDCDG